MPVWTLDPNDLHAIVGVARLEGWADGSFATIEMNAEMYELTVGADGRAVRNKSNDQSGRFTFRLLPNSPSNLVLAAMAVADRIANKGVLPVNVTLFSTTPPTLFTSPGAWVVKDPGQTFSVGSTDAKEWILETDQLIIVHGAEKVSVNFLGL